MRNPNSTTNSVEAFRRALIPPPPGAIPVLQMGEVDCGFVIWYRAEKYGESVEAQMQASVDAYFEFVDELIAAGHSTVVITGATPQSATENWTARSRTFGVRSWQPICNAPISPSDTMLR